MSKGVKNRRYYPFIREGCSGADVELKVGRVRGRILFDGHGRELADLTVGDVY